MLDPGHIVESVMVEEDPHEMMPVISLETSDDGTTRRTETTVSLCTFRIFVNFLHLLSAFPEKLDGE